MPLQFHKLLNFLDEIFDPFVMACIFLVEEDQVVEGEYLLFGELLFQLLPLYSPILLQNV